MQEKISPEPEPRDAWQAAEAVGFDMSIVEANLRLTPWERILNHSRALNLALQLREAMQKQIYGGS